ncbi:MAG: EamA family transporter [Burkholderiaceae bacterium]|nr:MAG: EamA family transporter [Burkholderiaceae bacterium]
MKSNQSDYGAMALIALIVPIWGSAWVVMKFLNIYIGAFNLVFVRYVVGFVALLIIQLALRQPLRASPFWFTLGIAVFQTTASQCLVQFALIAGGAGKVVMMVYTLPFWVALFAWIFLGDRPGKSHFLGFILAALGLLAVISPWRDQSTIFSMLLAIAGGASWAMGTVFSKMLFQRHKNINVLNLTTWQMLLGALLVLPFALVVPQSATQWSWHVALGLAYLGVMSSAIAWVLWLLVVRRVSATVAGMSGLGVPVFTVLLAWALLGERPTLVELVGIVLMLAGLAVVNLAAKSNDRPVAV